MRLSERTVAVAVWLVSRAVILFVTLGWFEGDTSTYFRQGHLWWSDQVPYRDFPAEYPPAAVFTFALIALTGGFPVFRVAFILIAFALDGVVTWLLWRHPRWLASSAAHPGIGVVVYCLATAALAPVIFVRYDLLPSLAVLAAVLLLGDAASGAATTPTTSDRHSQRPLARGRGLAVGALLGAAVAWKLYAVLLFPLLWLRLWPRTREQLTTLLLLSGAALAVVLASALPALAAGSGGAMFSFLRYQGERGLQIESSYSAVLLLANVFHPLALWHQHSHMAHDIAGPWAAAVVPWVKPVQLLAVVLATLLAWRRQLAWPSGFALVIGAAVLTANVFSPQFLLWLLPLLVLGIRNQRDPAIPMLLAVTVLTTLIFPTLYPRLLDLRTDLVVALVLRNGLLIALLAHASRQIGPLAARARSAVPACAGASLASATPSGPE